MNNPAWLIVGQGAIGSLMAVRLAALDVPVQVKLRPGQGTQGELLIRSGAERFRLATVENLTAPSWIFAAVKAYQVAPLIHELRSFAGFQASTLIVSYNGMLTDEASLLRDSDLHWITTHGAYREADAVIHAGHGQSWLGPQQAEQPAPAGMVEQLGRALPPLSWTRDIGPRRWQKLAVNCLINPFTVIHKCKNGDISRYISADLWQQVADEITALAAQRGVELSPESLIQQAQQVVKATANNRSSMLQDYLQQRPTEIDYLNGFVASASVEAGLSAPANQKLWQQVLDLTSGPDLR